MSVSSAGMIADHTVADAIPLALREPGGLFDGPSEPAFDDIVLLAATVCATASALVSLVGTERQWFKAKHSFAVQETPIEQSVCRHAMEQRDLLVIPDLTADPRTRDNPLVTGAPHLRFYAGAPMISPGGLVFGTVCVLDAAPRPQGLTGPQAAALEALARQTVELFETRARMLLRERQLGEQAHGGTAAEAGRVGTFDIDIAAGEITASSALCRIYGIPAAPRQDYARFRSLVIPEDRAITVIPDAGAGDDALDIEYRIRRADDGHLRWIARRARFVRDAEGRASRITGTVQDVTDQKLVSLRTTALMQLGDRLRDAVTPGEAIHEAARLLGTTLDATRAGYATFPQSGRLLSVEQDWCAPGGASLVGRYAVDGLLHDNFTRLSRGETVVASDMTLVAGAGWHLSHRIRALLVVPLFVAGRLAATLFLHDETPRLWSDEEVGFMRGVADRTYAAVAALEAEALQRTLNGELEHRLKNTLAMVQAIARQTLRAVPDRAPVDAFEQRLLALAGAHDVLTRERWQGAVIGEIVATAMTAIGQDGRCTVSGPPVTIGAKAALSLALLLHELATNALKYGAWSAADGRITIAWRIEPGDDPFLVFDWRETGGPPAREPTRRGFGSRLVKAGLAGTGGVVLRYDPTGFKAEMRAALAQLNQS